MDLMRNYMATSAFGWLLILRKEPSFVHGKDRQATARFPACQICDQTITASRLGLAVASIRETYPEEFYHSAISHHFFVRMAPVELRNHLSKCIWTNKMLLAIRKSFPPRTKCIPDVYDEIYLMRPEFDFLDGHKAHYDGILNIPGLHTIRSITYLEGTTATLVASSTQMNFTTDVGSTILLDFNRELHFALLSPKGYACSTNTLLPARVMIKAAIHVMGPRTPRVMIMMHIIAHRLVFFGIKSVRTAFESSESKLLIALDNVLRSLNKIHMVLPLTLIGVPLILVLMAPFMFPFDFLQYLIYIVWICFTAASSPQQVLALRVVAAIGLVRAATGFTLSPKVKILHLAWLGLCQYMKKNAAMAHHILLAPIPSSIELDNL